MARKYQWTMLSAIGGTVTEVRDGFASGLLPLSEQVMQPTKVYHAGAITPLLMRWRLPRFTQCRTGPKKRCIANRFPTQFKSV